LASCCPNQRPIRTHFYFFSLLLSESLPDSDSLLLVWPLAVRITARFGLTFTHLASCCPNHCPIRTHFYFFDLLLSESLPDSDSLLLFWPLAVRITTRFGLTFTCLAACCPNHCPIRTHFYFFGRLMSESLPDSDSLILFWPLDVRITARFGLTFTFLAACCPNHCPIRTHFYFFGRLLSESLPDSDSLSLFWLLAVRITTRFGLTFTHLAACCPNYYPIRTHFHSFGLLLSESLPDSDSLLLFWPLDVRITARFGLTFTFLAACYPNRHPIRTHFYFFGRLMSESLPDSDSLILFWPLDVRITARFGLTFTFLAACCPNHYPIRTHFHPFGRLLSETHHHGGITSSKLIIGFNVIKMV
jgi:hypothetical protein